MTARKKCKRATQRKSSRLAKKPRNVYVCKDNEEYMSSEEDRLSDFIKDSESSDSEDSDASDSDVSEKMTLRDTRRSMATRRNVRASTRKARRSYGEDSTSGEESDESSESSDSSRSSSQSFEDEDSGPSSEKKKQSKDSSRPGKKGATTDSDEDVSGLSNSAKKRKKASQVESSDEDQKKVRKRIVTPADDESDSADEHHSKKESVTDKDEELLVTTTNRGKSESVTEGDKNDVKNEDESATVKTSNEEEDESTSTSDDKKHPNGTASDENKPAKDEPASEESRETRKDPNLDDNAKNEDTGSFDAPHTANCQRNGTPEKKSVQAVDSSDENKAKIPSNKSDPENVLVESKLKKNKTPKAERTPSKYEGRQKALKKLMKQRNKKQGGDQSTSASEEEEEEEDEDGNRVSEDDFIVSDEDDDEMDDQPGGLQDHETEETRVYEVKKAKLQSLIELMLCAHLQEDPGEYLRTAKFNREIPEETHNDIAAVTNRLESAISLVFSEAWKKDYKDAIQRHPKFSNFSNHSRVNCEACGRVNHPSSQGIKFSGIPYNRETFETEEFGSYDKTFRIGRFCHERSEMYHRLYHFRHKLFHSCGAQVNKALNIFHHKKGDRDPDIDKVINQCMKNEFWMEKMFSHMEKILDDAHNYTTDKKYSAGIRQMLG